MVSSDTKHRLGDLAARFELELRGDPELMRLMDRMLESFVKQQRMRLPGVEYQPCYRLVA